MLTACLRPLRILPVDGGPFYLPTLAMVLAGVVLLSDFLETDFAFQPRRWVSAMDVNIVLGCLALLVGGAAAAASARNYARFVPLELRGCRWTRVPERDATLFTFLATNVEASSDSFVARNGLASLHFWANRPPVSKVMIGNQWDVLDPAMNDSLLASHRNRLRMMFIDNPVNWYLDSHRLAFKEFAAALPAHAFLDFVGQHFKQLARVANCRLLVRKERKDLDLYACAYVAGTDPRHEGLSLLRIKLPEKRELKDVATIELVDLDSGEQTGSTAPGASAHEVLLLDGTGRRILPNAGQALAWTSFDPDRPVFLAYPTSIRLDRASFPAIRFLNTRGKRLLTLPVAVDTCLITP